MAMKDRVGFFPRDGRMNQMPAVAECSSSTGNRERFLDDSVFSKDCSVQNDWGLVGDELAPSNAGDVFKVEVLAATMVKKVPVLQTPEENYSTDFLREVEQEEDNASWFKDADVVMLQQDCNRVTDSLESSQGLVMSSDCEICDGLQVPEGNTTHSRRGRGRPPKNNLRIEVQLQTGVFQVRSREMLKREAKTNVMSLDEPAVREGEVLPKRGRGRPRKDGGSTAAPSKKKGSAMQPVQSFKSGRKRGRPQKYFEADMDASELCGRCCVKIGKKFDQDIRDRELHLRIAAAGCRV